MKIYQLHEELRQWLFEKADAANVEELPIYNEILEKIDQLELKWE